ncbi:MAG: 3',5'-cyclic adenosine monophosphate phosphodiesterase CpdA [Eubacteriales bacterium SKADARSKE-1]|nr:3',5'-cyclic adenosine monophosphate phosphodiesterase CpdA [Eubacteriales bacterium SKADARSKE-1]
MALYAIADLHLAFSTGKIKSMNIFPGWENYTEKLESNWRKKVTDNDTVVIAGDISWAKRLDESYEDFAFIESLPGRKLLIKGNHDYWWTSRKKMDTYFAENSFNSISVIFNSTNVVENFAVCGTRGWFFDSSTDEDIKVLKREVGRLETSIKLAEQTGAQPVAFLHYPPVYGDFECEEIMSVLISHNIKKCYYGHVHGKNAAKRVIEGEYKGIDFKLISCDYLKFTPVLVGG